MTVIGLSLAYEDKGIRVYVERRAQVALRHVVRQSLLPLEEVFLGSLGAPEPDASSESLVETVPMRLRGLAPGDDGQPGVIVAPEEHSAALFLLDRYEPRGEDDIEAVIREARSRKGSKWARAEWLVNQLARDDDEDDDWAPPFRMRRRRGRSRSRCIWVWREFSTFFRKLAHSSPPIFLPVVECWPRFAEYSAYLVRERMEDLRGHRVPQWDILAVKPHRDRTPTVRGWCAGRWIDQPLWSLDPRLQEVFDREGRFVRVRGMDLWMGEVLSPRFVVRVPNRRPSKASRDPYSVPEPLRALPAAYLRDSRCPMPSLGDLPVVDEPVAAWAVLLRTVCGVFQPDASPMDPPESFYSLGGAYLVGSVPDLDLRGKPA